MLIKKNSLNRKFFLIAVTGIALSLVFVLSPTFHIDEDNFQIKTDKENYSVNERVFVYISDPNRDDSGTLIVTDPNNQIHSRMFFSGRTGIAEPYIDLSRYAKECQCDVTGLWKIQYDVIEGDYYQTTLFWVG